MYLEYLKKLKQQKRIKVSGISPGVTWLCDIGGGMNQGSVRLKKDPGSRSKQMEST